MTVTAKELDKLSHANFDGDTYEQGIFRAIQKIVGEKTDNFTNPDGISPRKEDMTEDIENAGKSVEDYKRKFGSVKRSEEDVVHHLIDVIDGKEFTPPPATDDSSDDIDEDFELEMEMELELQNQLNLKLKLNK